MSAFFSRQTIGLCFLLGFGALACGSEMPESGAEGTDEVTSSNAALHRASRRSVNDVLLVHGAWADGSCWSAVIQGLQHHGFSVRAVQLREQSVADDAAIVRHEIEAIGRPLVVAGHSYGGFVSSEATAGASNVVALVFVAAFAPDAGETLYELTSTYPTTPAIANLMVDDQLNTVIEPQAFVRYFAPDIPTHDARVLAAVQHPTAFGILSEAAGEPGWRTIPSYYQISLEDQVIDPRLQRMFADRMDAHTIELRASHVSLISRPKQVTGLIERAASAR